MNKLVELLGTPKKEDWPEGFKQASKISNTLIIKIIIFLTKRRNNFITFCLMLIQSLLICLTLCYNIIQRKDQLLHSISLLINIRILKHEYFSSIKVPDQNIDPHNETKFSFYEKEVIEIPKNIKV